MKIAYCQIGTHPCFVGVNGSYNREPFLDEGGPLLTSISNNPSINGICDKIEHLYIQHLTRKIKEILNSIKGIGLEMLVFPEYCIPAEILPLIYHFAQSEKCVCVAASHTIQGVFKEIYNSINMEIDLSSKLNMSCCPVILPTGLSIPVYKKYKSKWESNMQVEGEKYYKKGEKKYIEYNGMTFAVQICIDALKEDVDTNKVKFVVVPAASRSLGQFKNKFEGYLSKDTPTIFCNSYDYGGSTVYCHMPMEFNMPFSNSSHIVPMDKIEEAICVVDVEMISHSMKIKTINSNELVKVDYVAPIYYKDNHRELALADRFKELIENRSTEELSRTSNILLDHEPGIISIRNKILFDGINSQTMEMEEMKKFIKIIYISDFCLQQYEINWATKTSNILQEMLLKGDIPFAESVVNVQKRLYEYISKLTKIINEKIDISVFEEAQNDSLSFQNRGGEIQQFKKVFQESEKTVFILNAFSGIGKSALIDRLRNLYSFNVISKSLPSSAGFESLLRVFCEITDRKISWDTLDAKEIDGLALQFAQDISGFNKSIVVLKKVGNIFDDYNKEKSIFLITSIARYLNKHSARIKIIIETHQILPEKIKNNEHIFSCKLKPLINLYIERLIEQVTNNLSYNLSLPKIPHNVVTACDGNPTVAKMIGVYFAKKINTQQDITLSKNEVENFTSKYVDGILTNLNITEQEKRFLQDISVFRIPVKVHAFEKFQSYSSRSFEHLVEKMLIDESDGLYSLNSLIRNRLYNSSVDMSLNHSIAAKYYEIEYTANKLSYMDKAEFLFHNSFTNSRVKDQDLKYFTDDILSAAIELCGQNKVEIALSHLNAIKKWKSKYWKYQIYVAYCNILIDDYGLFDEAFQTAISLKGDNTDIVYYIMIKNLIRSRKLVDAENILNEAEDIFGTNPQILALRISLLYSNHNTRNLAIDKAISQSHEQYYDLHASKIIVPILVREGYSKEAISELDKVLSVWKSNNWANSIKHRIQKGVFNQSEEYEDDIDE